MTYLVSDSFWIYAHKCSHLLQMQPKSGSDQNTIRVEKGKYWSTFKSTPLPSLGLVASLTASGFCFLKAGFCLKEAPSPCEGFSARMESQQAEPWRAHGGQHIPLAHSQAHFRTAAQENSPLGQGFLLWQSTNSEMGAARSLAFLKNCFIDIQGVLVYCSSLHHFHNF